jgi:hypothetical protein
VKSQDLEEKISRKVRKFEKYYLSKEHGLLNCEENLSYFQDDKISRKLITVAGDLRKNEVTARKKLWSALGATLMIALNGGYISLLLNLVPDSYSYITSSVDF